MNQLVENQPIVNTEYSQTNVLVIRALLEIHTKFVELKIEQPAVHHNVVLAPNVAKSQIVLNAAAHMVTPEIPMFNVTISTNVWRIHAAQTPSVSTHPEATIANVVPEMLEIHLSSVHQFRKISATILPIANAEPPLSAHQVLPVKMADAVISVIAFRAVPVLSARSASACVRSATSAIQAIPPRDATSEASAKSIMTARTRRSVSNWVEVCESVWMLAVNSNAVQTHFACQAIIGHLVFALTAILAIQMTCKADANVNIRNLFKINVAATAIAIRAMSAWLEQTVNTIVSIHALPLPAEQTNNVNWTTIQIPSAIARTTMYGIPYRQRAKNHPFPIVEPIQIAIKQPLAVPISLAF